MYDQDNPTAVDMVFSIMDLLNEMRGVRTPWQLTVKLPAAPLGEGGTAALDVLCRHIATDTDWEPITADRIEIYFTGTQDSMQLDLTPLCHFFSVATPDNFPCLESLSFR